MTDPEAMARIIRGVMWNLDRSALAGAIAKIQNVVTLRDRMDRLTPGDLVVEVSTMGMRDRDINAVGYLLEIAQEPVDFGDPAFVWDEEAEGSPHPKERIVYIRTLDDRRFRWSNATFVAVPHEWPFGR